MITRVREASGDPAGAIIALHGRGADEHDLFPLLDFLDPARRCLGVALRAPLNLPPGGAHWYEFYRVGEPDPASFWSTTELVNSWLQEFSEQSGITRARTVLVGFSQGAVMSYALGLGAGQARPAGIIALSGFVPSVPGFEVDLSDPRPRLAVGHGTQDPVISVEFGRAARELFQSVGADLIYRETVMGHTLDIGFLEQLRSWLESTLNSQSHAQSGRD